MPVTEKKSINRDITYQVGWKKGKIHVQDSAPSSATALSSTASAETVAVTAAVKGKADAPLDLPAAQTADRQGSEGKLMGIIWKSLPYPPEKIAFLCAAVLPVAAFAAVVWLVSKLSQG